MFCTKRSKHYESIVEHVYTFPYYGARIRKRCFFLITTGRPINKNNGQRTYVMMQPYVREPNLTLTIELYDKPKQYADQESPIGKVIRSRHEGFKEVQVGNAQAWYYHTDKTIVLWECFFDGRFMKHPLPTDGNMQNLWKRFELWLIKKFPKASTLAIPFNDPIAESIEEYQAFLKSLGYSPLARGAFGKKL